MNNIEKDAEEYIKGFPKNTIFAPNSIWHGWPNTSRLSKESHLRIELERLRDFVEWLFEEENIHWMSQSEAWEKFNKKEIVEFLSNGNLQHNNLEDNG